MPSVRSVFLSDIHLGARASQAGHLLDFLREYPAEQMFLIGDTIDFWAMSRSIHWSAAQNAVVQKILCRARCGEKVIFIPGNHDEALRDHHLGAVFGALFGAEYGDIRLEREWVHRTADGRQFLLVHGDEFDHVTRDHKWASVLGDKTYNALARTNPWLAWWRRKLGISGDWSLAGFAKRKVKRVVAHLSNLEQRVIQAARERGLDGVIFGHIHLAALREVDGVMYINCGDWVDSCSAVVEHHDGRLELVWWNKVVPATPANERHNPPCSKGLE
ncbi:MAG: UDP-2,3-diacylglucosamine diphosphatase [Burkholderiaceae bacterium]|jgi:UDP-2,3-diacylglucosamine pyrophosphatase LpxH|nr:UDP-2,3-diacylglucosamine diphosphatase [Burkholderiaceae bacterium]